MCYLHVLFYTFVAHEESFAHRENAHYVRLLRTRDRLVTTDLSTAAARESQQCNIQCNITSNTLQSSKFTHDLHYKFHYYECQTCSQYICLALEERISYVSIFERY